MLDINFYQKFQKMDGAKKDNIIKIVANLQKLKKEHNFDNKQVDEAIQKADLPMDYHFYITANFSKLCEFIK